ncbi:MAG: phosphoribosylformylglycinamidine synthase subunit PurS [Alicyclobacillus herbarius]|uniref:phosphoribosylformylglycinamidine synthase subunit PurS n=1 Tax=Alicyclobacillus herbarius TaxID=122960 RepID=UPI00041BAC42|nr:phosphoribosylformylglycinamidine synthase subunit PurS [Alicyclobacillus herbarius]MCL6632227.1 phosphoribosylformylglycinamidine synthase subunit PurS [Alicyclobacillus herbarius]
MTKWRATVRVWLKPSVFDPQGHAVLQALTSLGHDGVENVRIGKSMELTVTAKDKAEAEAKVRRACDELLCNPVMETYAYQVEEGA